MDTKFKKKSEIKHGIFTIALQGAIADSADFGDPPVEPISQIYIDFEGVRYVNSVGIKQWMNWIARITAKHPKAQFQVLNCQESIVNQINAIRGFLPKNSIVKSFYVPMICEVCGENHSVLYRAEHEYDPKFYGSKLGLQHPDKYCAKCNVKLEIDVYPETYFQFLKK